MIINNDKIYNIIYKNIIKYVLPYKNLLLAFSGGLDSTVLLDAINIIINKINLSNKKKEKINFRAIHINHKLSNNSNLWMYHCKNECKIRNIIFNYFTINIKKTNKGIESDARNARYNIFLSELKKNEVLITAHNKEDQAETVLLSLKRGSGPAGLSGMVHDAPFYGYRIIRPFLNLSKLTLEKYAKKKSLKWIHDESNLNIKFDRNFLRLKIFPILKKRWPQINNSIIRSALLCKIQENLLEEILSNQLYKFIHKDGSLKILNLIEMSNAKRLYILRMWLKKFNFKMPSLNKLLHIWKNIAISRKDSIAQLNIENKLIRRFHNRLYVISLIPKIPNNFYIIWKKEKTKIKLPFNLGILKRSIINNQNIKKKNIFFSETIVRAPLNNEKIYIKYGSIPGIIYTTYRSRGRTLKKIWQELNIPPWYRRIIPLLFYNDIFISAIGVFITLNGNNNNNYINWKIIWKNNINKI